MWRVGLTPPSAVATLQSMLRPAMLLSFLLVGCFERPRTERIGPEHRWPDAGFVEKEPTIPNWRRKEIGDGFQKLFETGLITTMDFDAGEFWVNPRFWVSMTYQEKQALAESAAIHVETRTNGVRRVVLRDSMNGRTLGRFSKSLGFSINN